MRCVTGLRDSRLHRLMAVDGALKDDPFLDYAPGVGFVMQMTGKPVDDVSLGPNRPVNVDIAVRCRKCPACLRARAAHWRLRAQAEVGASNRTWFGTLTLAPENQFKAISQARSRLAGMGIDFDALPSDDRFAERHKQIAPEITRYIKRVRKQSGVPLRYVIVAEAHASGAPHYHLLIHERGDPVRHRVLQGQWLAGFSNWKLVHDEKAAAYVTKYLSKSALAKIRASSHYGDSSGIHDDTVTVGIRTARTSTF